MEVFFLERYSGPTAVAMFAVGITLCGLATRVPLLLTGALLPHFAHCFGAGDSSGIKRTYAAATRLTAFMLFPCSLGLAAVMPTLLPYLFGEAFIPAVPTAMVLAAFSLLAFSSVGSALLYGSENPSFIAWSCALGAVLSLGACLLIIPRWGSFGAACSRSAVQVAMVGLGAWYISSRLACPFPARATGRILLAAVLSAVCAFLLAHNVRGPAGVAVAVRIGAAAYLVAVRALHALPQQDCNALRLWIEKLPVPVSSLMARTVVWLGGAE